ncbi:MAG: C25 family peptidase C-terminal domain-containing protein, partial [Bacteroidales bacterium]|nr:C25 family peptidase C-terminal domain-containing protein [Bacteroidales bacterium]
NSSMKKYYWEIYNLMGDPSLSVYFSIPPALTASYPGNIAQTETSLTVTAEPWSYVALSVNDSILLDARLVDSTGTTTLMFDPIPASNQVRIVITKQNRKPIIDSIPIGAFSVELTVTPPDVCIGDTSQFNVEVSGGSGVYTYQWTPTTYLSDTTSATPFAVVLENTTYTVTVNDGVNTVTSSPVDITVMKRPETPVITLEEDSLVSNAIEGNQWYANGVPIAGETGQSITPAFSANYYVIVTDISFDCPSSLPSNVIPYYMTTLSDPYLQNMVQIYPVPSKDFLNIRFRLPETGSILIKLLDAFGREVRILHDNSDLPAGIHSMVVPCSDLATGIYYCQIQTKSYNIIKKVFVNK